MNDHDTNGEQTPADDATSTSPTTPVDGDETTTADAVADAGTAIDDLDADTADTDDTLTGGTDAIDTSVDTPVDTEGDESTDGADASPADDATGTTSPDARPRRRGVLTAVAAGVIGLAIGAGAAFGAHALFGDDHGGRDRGDHGEMHGDRHGDMHDDMSGDMAPDA